MTKNFLQQQKKRLEEKKEQLKKELKSFAKRDPRIKGNWKSKFPNFGSRTSDPSEQQDQIEQYETNLSLEYSLEKDLARVRRTLKRIKIGKFHKILPGQDKYGICKKCKKQIQKERLEIYPEAETCVKCSSLYDK